MAYHANVTVTVIEELLRQTVKFELKCAPEVNSVITVYAQ